MPKFERSPGFPERIERVRGRFDLNETDFAEHFDITQPTYAGWLRGSGTAAITLKRGLVSLGVVDLDRALSWLADGGGEEPYWLNGEPGSPIPPGGPDGVVAMPMRVLDVGREAFRVLDGARVAGSLRDPTALRAWSVLERETAFRETTGGPSRGSRWTSASAQKPIARIANVDDSRAA